MLYVRLVASCAFCLLMAPGQTPRRFAVYRAAHPAEPWAQSHTGLPDARVNAFTIVDGVVLAGSDAGIFLSVDEGRSWRPPLGTGRRLPTRILSLASIGTTAYAGTDGAGLWISLDKGRTWLPDPSLAPRRIRSLHANSHSVFAGTDGQGVWVSEPGPSRLGRTWRSLADGLPADGQVFSLVTLRGRLFAALYAKGLYLWPDNGQRWSRVGSVTPLALSAAGDTLIAGHNPGGLLCSDDLGATWTAILSNALQPANAPVWELGSHGDLALAGAARGIFHTADRGRTWTQAHNGLPPDWTGVAFLVRNGFVLASTTGR